MHEAMHEVAKHGTDSKPENLVSHHVLDAQLAPPMGFSALAICNQRKRQSVPLVGFEGVSGLASSSPAGSSQLMDWPDGGSRRGSKSQSRSTRLYIAVDDDAMAVPPVNSKCPPDEDLSQHGVTRVQFSWVDAAIAAFIGIRLVPRPQIWVKGKGVMQTFWAEQMPSSCPQMDWLRGVPRKRLNSAKRFVRKALGRKSHSQRVTSVPLDSVIADVGSRRGRGARLAQSGRRSESLGRLQLLGKVNKLQAKGNQQAVDSGMANDED